MGGGSYWGPATTRETDILVTFNFSILSSPIASSLQRYTSSLTSHKRPMSGKLLVYTAFCFQRPGVPRPRARMAPFVNGTSHSNSLLESSAFPLQTHAKAISSAADVITEYCISNDLPHPSFRPDASTIMIPLTAPVAVQDARQTLIDAATKTQQIITEPADYLPRLAVHVRSLDWLFSLLSTPA